jgi:diguanylate cyclase (GGDEF)-like protein
LNEALRVSLICDSPEDSISTLLEYLGLMLQSDRIYIFENRFDGFYDNTYEWCAKGVTPQIDNLKDFPEKDLRIWLDRFKSGNNIMIDKLEDIKETDPVMYDYLLPQEINSLVAGPLSFQNRIIGFYGVDNPPENMMKNISNLFMIMGHFIVSLLRRRDLVSKLEHLSFYDKLTGLGNRHRMDDCIDRLNMEKSIGIINCDVMGLKVVNDSKGHQAGDDLLVRASDSLRKAFSEKNLFRTGGDEFLVLCSGIEKEDFENRTRILDEEMRKQSALMAYGAVWRENVGGNINALLSEADERMYERKRAYYAEKKRDRRS